MSNGNSEARQRGEEAHKWLDSLSVPPSFEEASKRDEELADYFEFCWDWDDHAPWCEVMIGPDDKGRLLEIGIIQTDDGENLICHAAPLRAPWYPQAFGFQS